MNEPNTRLAVEVTSDAAEFFSAVQDPECPWFGVRLFRTSIRRNIRLSEAPSFGQSIFEYSSQSHGAEDYRQLAREVLGLPLEEGIPSLSTAAA